MTPADELRQAAEKLRKRAEEPFQGEKAIHPSRREDCLWLASMPKYVAEPLAAMLDGWADALVSSVLTAEVRPAADGALAFARRVNAVAP